MPPIRQGANFQLTAVEHSNNAYTTLKNDDNWGFGDLKRRVVKNVLNTRKTENEGTTIKPVSCSNNNSELV